MASCIVDRDREREVDEKSLGQQSRPISFPLLDFLSRDPGAHGEFFHIIVENDQAELEPKKLETADSSSFGARRYVANRPTHMRRLGDSGNDVILEARLPVPDLLLPALEK